MCTETEPKRESNSLTGANELGQTGSWGWARGWAGSAGVRVGRREGTDGKNSSTSIGEGPGWELVVGRRRQSFSF